LPAAARHVFATGGGGAQTDFNRRRQHQWKTGGGVVRQRYRPTFANVKQITPMNKNINQRNSPDNSAIIKQFFSRCKEDSNLKSSQSLSS